MASRYTAQGKCWLEKLIHLYGFVAWRRRASWKIKETTKHRGTILVWNPKRHITLVSLLLCCKIAAVQCFIWHLGLRMWRGSETKFRVLQFLKNSMSSYLKMFSCFKCIIWCKIRTPVLFCKGDFYHPGCILVYMT